MIEQSLNQQSLSKSVLPKEPVEAAALPDLAAKVIEQALRQGASDAECTILQNQEFSSSVRIGEIENLTQAGSRGVGLGR